MAAGGATGVMPQWRVSLPSLRFCCGAPPRSTRLELYQGRFMNGSFRGSWFFMMRGARRRRNREKCGPARAAALSIQYGSSLQARGWLAVQLLSLASRRCSIPGCSVRQWRWRRRAPAPLTRTCSSFTRCARVASALHLHVARRRPPSSSPASPACRYPRRPRQQPELFVVLIPACTHPPTLH
jgi:hypothetical protein